MPLISELFEASIDVIVRYHKVKLSLSPEAEYEILLSLLHKTHVELIPELQKLIHAAVTVDTKDEARRPLLMYILHNISIMKSVIDDETPIEKEALKLIESQLIQYITDMQRLLNRSSTTETTINYNKKNINLFGLMGWTLRSLSLSTPCTSGTIITETLFPALKLSIEASPSLIQRAISNMLQNHQYNLLKLRSKINEKDAEQAILEKKIVALELELHTTKQHLKVAKDQTRAQLGYAEPLPYRPRVMDSNESSLKSVIRASATVAQEYFFPLTTRTPAARATLNTPTEEEDDEVYYDGVSKF